MLVRIADFLILIVVFALLLYLKYKTLESRTKDLGDGGIQTLFGNKKSK